MDGSTRHLSRRAFVRGAVVTSVAAVAAATRSIHAPAARGATEPDAVPRLDVDTPVGGVASRAGRFVAVGGHVNDPRTWSLETSAGGWSESADATGFPGGTSLVDVAADTAGYAAAGWRETDGGPRPAVFASADGTTWAPASLPDIRHGVGIAIAAKDGAAIAAATTFDEPDVREPVRTVAFVREIGGAWSVTPLDGVRPPTHGSVTMLAATRSGFLLGTMDITGERLYAATSARGPWRALPVPKSTQPVSFVAATDTANGLLLAGIDALDRPRYWLDGSRGWREVTAPKGVDAASHVVGFARSDAALVAAGSDATGSFVEEVTAA